MVTSNASMHVDKHSHPMNEKNYNHPSCIHTEHNTLKLVLMY